MGGSISRLITFSQRENSIQNTIFYEQISYSKDSTNNYTYNGSFTSKCQEANEIIDKGE